MTRMTTYPTLAEFLRAPLEEVRTVAPATLILGAGGTRRRAVLAGLDPTSDEYAEWTRKEMMACHEMLFRYGVKHIFSAILIDGHRKEVTEGYSEKLVKWVRYGLADSEALAEYARLGWQVRLVGVESWPELKPVADRLAQVNPQHDAPRVWFSISSETEKQWSLLLRIAQMQRLESRHDLIRAFYGEEIPLATMYLGTGKPQIVESIVPPLLIGKMECYWRQHLGYDLDERTLRAIFYDYAFSRDTWRADKTGRRRGSVGILDCLGHPPCCRSRNASRPLLVPRDTA